MSRRSGAEGRTPRGRGSPAERRRRIAVWTLPVLASAVSQMAAVQGITHPFWEVMADLVAPAWALVIVPVAGRLAAAARRYGTPLAGAESALATRLTARNWAIGAARAAQIGAGAIIVLSWTREWERFGEQPDAIWFALVVLTTFGLLLVPLWWIRTELHYRGTRFLDSAALPSRIGSFLFDEDEGRPARWAHLLAFSVVTLVVAFTVLGQFDALLRGMHLSGDPAVGISGLPGIDEFDLSAKPDVVVRRVEVWRSYTESVGGRFGSAYGVVAAHAAFDTLVTIPAYLAAGVTLAFVAWRRRLHFGVATEVRRAFELVVMAGLVVLVATAFFDLAKNILTWIVMDRAWNAPASVGDLPVRLLWGFSLARTLGFAILGAAVLLLVALADISTRRLRSALVAVRSEVLVLAIFGLVVLMLPQTADVIRDWRVSHALITVLLATVLAMLLRWTSVQNLRLQQRHWRHADEGVAPAPRRVLVPRLGSTPLGSLVGGAIVGGAALQMLLTWADVPAGRGLLIPAALVLAFWVLGLPLPVAPFHRGNRPVPPLIRRRLPRTLGSLVFLIVGVAVLKAAVASVAYARHEDWWLAFAMVPPAIGFWRILTRTTSTMGRLEAGFAAVVLVVVAPLFAAGDPELSPATLAFTGVTFAYGSLAFFNSYERASLVNRISHRFLSPAWAKPFVALTGGALALAVVWFMADPIRVAPRIGTIGMIAMAMMVVGLLGAGAIRLAELTRPPRLLAAFGFRRSPLVVLFLVWLLLAPSLADQGVNDVRLTSGGAGSALGFGEVWERWAANNLSDAAGASEAGRPVVPMLLVSSSGGGLRAAAWTSFVLDCVFEGEAGASGPCDRDHPGGTRMEQAAVLSGVSGGSLGMAAYVAHVLDGVEGDGGDSWVDETMGDDYLAAPIGWLFFVDLPRSLVGSGPGIGNRAALMERAWEASWPDEVDGLRRGVGATWEADPRVPAMIFNGSSVNDGCRVNLSPFDLGGNSPDVPSCTGLQDGREATDGGLGATHDLVDHLCPGDDVSLATAAGLSARFPVVAVAGRLAAEEGCREAESGAVYVVDGGYTEGSGAGTLLDAWEGLRPWVEAHNVAGEGPCVVPFMVHIDNGYESPDVVSQDAPPRELLVPALTIFHSSSGIVMARSEAALVFEHPFTIGGTETELLRIGAGDEAPVASRYVRLVTRAHPGVQAPLGWTLSQASIDDLRDQLAIEQNAAALEEIRSWLEGTMVCAGG